MEESKHKYRLYAYRIDPTTFSSNKSDFTSNLIRHFNEIKENNYNRRYTPDKNMSDEDVLSYYIVYPNRNLVFGIIFRITPTKEVPDIPENFFDTTLFSPSQLKNLKELKEKGYRCKNIYYFMSNDTHLITNLPRRNIGQLEKYMNWFLTVYRGEELYKFYPIIEMTSKQLKDIKSITFGGNPSLPDRQNTDNESKSFNQHILKVTEECLKKLLVQDNGIKELLDKGVISAQLIVKVDKNKQKKLDDDSIKKALSAVVVNIPEDNSVTIKTNENLPMNAGSIHLIKDVEVDEIAPGLGDEKQISLKMEEFISSLKGRLR